MWERSRRWQGGRQRPDLGGCWVLESKRHHDRRGGILQSFTEGQSKIDPHLWTTV